MSVFNHSLVVHLLCGFVLFLLIFRCTTRGSLLRRLLSGVIVGILVAFLSTYAVRGQLQLKTLGKVILVWNNYYIALLVYLFQALLVWLAVLLFRYLRLIRNEKQCLSVLLLLLIPITAIECYIGYYNTKRPAIRRYTIHLPRRAGMPDSLRLFFVTDVHIGEIIQEQEIEHLVSLAQAEHPDYVLLGGDIMDYYEAFAENEKIKSAMRSLHPDKEHILYVLGNHEYYYHTEQKKHLLREIGTLLVDSVVPLGNHLYLLGRDDYTNEQRRPLSQLKQSIGDPDAVTILLDHQPNCPQEVRDAGIDLALHGHTHNGQFIPFKWAVALRFEYSYGLYKRGGTTFCISSGYGAAGSPFRVGTRSEVVLLTLLFDL